MPAVYSQTSFLKRIQIGQQLRLIFTFDHPLNAFDCIGTMVRQHLLGMFIKVLLNVAPIGWE